MKPQIGSALAHKVAKFERTDPAPHIPFAEDGLSNLESLVCGTFAVAAFIATPSVAYVLSTL